jgi:3D (Asp-Asp-Asp) domain-containing protein
MRVKTVRGFFRPLPAVFTLIYNGRRPGIKDDIGFQQGSNVKINAPKRLSNSVKGKTPMV